MVSIWVWLATIAGLLALVVIDLFVVDRTPHRITTGEAARWVVFYFSCAVVFGVGVWLLGGKDPGVEFFTGYITEYSLSIDNLFIFMIIMSSFRVPEIHQHRVLLIGIGLALVMRGAFIAVGAALIAEFVWVFFIFGGILVWTAISMARGGDEGGEYRENAITRLIRKVFPVTEEYVEHRMVVKQEGKRFLTPMFVVIVAIGSADLLFAVDSIPAIFGITQEAYLVFTTNAFALMGLRQLYFLIGGLVARLVYLSYGLTLILGFIGAKLVLHALYEYRLIPAWLEIDNWVSLGVIGVVLTGTTVVSLWKSKRDSKSASTLDLQVTTTANSSHHGSIGQESSEKPPQDTGNTGG